MQCFVNYCRTKLDLGVCIFQSLLLVQIPFEGHCATPFRTSGAPHCYCLSWQVEALQEGVLQMLREVYGPIEVLRAIALLTPG